MLAFFFIHLSYKMFTIINDVRSIGVRPRDAVTRGTDS